MMTTRIGILAVAVCFAAPGTVVAEDTGLSIGGAVVVAIQLTASRAQRPAMYKAVTDNGGRYSMTVSAGQYQLCVHDTGVYLNPRQWGPASPAVTIAAAVTDLRLQKGAWFIVRIHDTPQLLPQVETVRGSGVTVHLSAASLREFPLPSISPFLTLADTSGNPLGQNAFQAVLTSPALSATLVQRSPLGRPVGPNIPSRVFNLVATGPVSH